MPAQKDNKGSDLAMVRRFAPFLRSYYVQLLAILLTVILLSGVSICLPLLIKNIIDEDAEKNSNPIRLVNGTVTFTDTTRDVTGTDTQFQSQLLPSQHIRAEGEAEFFEILSIESDTALTLRVDATYSNTGAAQYKGGQNFDTELDTLSCRVYGTTIDDTKSGTLLRKGPEIVKDILTKASVGNLNDASFTKANNQAPFDIGLAIPKAFDSTEERIVRDLINQVNLSIFGSLVQNEDFELEYNILQPRKPRPSLTLRRQDIITLSVDTNNDRVVKRAIIEFNSQEHNPESGVESLDINQKISDVGCFLVRTNRSRRVNTVLLRDIDAQILANRWAFLLELGTNVIKIRAKLKPARLQVNDIVEVCHPKLYERIGGGKRKFAAVQSIGRDGKDVILELDDLGNAFNSVGTITESDANDFDNATDDEKIKNGYITDQFGLINNDAETFRQNVIW